MNETIVNNWNNTVSNDDDVYILGDLMLGSTTNIEWIKKLNGNLHIVLGNHDTANREAMYKELNNVVEVACAIRLNYRKYHFFLTHFPALTGNLEKESLKQMTLNLYGHTHQISNFYEDRPYMYHVGVDSHNCYPVEIEDIINEMNDKVRECESFLFDEIEKESYYNISARTNTLNRSRCNECIYSSLTCESCDEDGRCPKYQKNSINNDFNKENEYKYEE